MAKFMNVTKEIVKLAGTSSVCLVLGGVVTAVTPPGVGLLFKGATYVGSCVVALAAADPIEKAIDSKFNDLDEIVEESKGYVELYRQAAELERQLKELKNEKMKEES